MNQQCYFLHRLATGIIDTVTQVDFICYAAYHFETDLDLVSLQMRYYGSHLFCSYLPVMQEMMVKYSVNFQMTF